MDRTFSARLGRTFVPAGGARRRRAKPRRRGRAGRRGYPSGFGGALTAGLTSLRRGAAFVWSRRRVRLGLLALLGTLALAGGGWVFLRHSPLTAVEQVRISGVHGADAARVDAALNGAAHRMSTLDVQRGALLAAVAPLHVVRTLSVSASFPRGLRIRVIEQPPVAVLVAGGMRTAVAADGVVLGPGLLQGPLPTVDAAGAEPLVGRHVGGPRTRAELSVLGGAPGVLLGWVEHVFTGSEGLTVTMRDGLSIYFGNATRARAKWLAAARVLADPSSAGATYIDVRLPERPAAGTTAAGGLAGSAAGAAQGGAIDPSTAALAATLDEAVSGGASTTAAASSQGETPSATPSATPSVAPGATGASTGEAAAAPGEAGAGSGAGEASAGAAAASAGTETPAATGASANGVAATSPEPSTSTSG
jgi:cell division protein FtsQ